MSIPLDLITSAQPPSSNSLLPLPASSLQPSFKSKGVRAPVPSSASIHPQRVELVCSYKPTDKDVRNNSDVSNRPLLISPLEPMIRAVLEKDPNYDLSGLDFMASRTSLRKLFRLVSGSGSRRKAPGELKFYVELIRPPHLQTGRYSIGDVAGTVLLSSGNLQEDDVAITGDDSGDDHGAEFLEHSAEILNSDKSTECSENTRIVTYDLAGMRCMIKYSPIGNLPATKLEQKNIQEQNGESEKCLRVRKRTKVRVINHVDEWRRNVHDRVSVDSKPYLNDDGNAVHDNVLGMTVSDDASISKDPEAYIWQLEKLDQVVDLSNAMERVGMHSDVQHDEIPQIKMTSFDGSRYTRQRGDSISSTSSAHSQASFRSMVSSRSSVSWGPGESPLQYHYHKRLQLLPTIAPTPPTEAESLTQYLGFDTPVSNIWYRANLGSSFFDVDAVEPLDHNFHEGEQAHKGPGCEIVGKYRSTVQYRKVLQAWENDHVENLRKLVVVLRKIRKAAGKAGRCKVVVDNSGRIRPYRVKQSKGEKETEIGRVSILPPDLLAKWV
ncbi:hypothetical protein BGX38DRAFT_1162034 [Terfezia claveryi]|nr:hypothetical protein BGX38DRAFT_1162034 [Terfezia claveryi]